MKYLSLIKANLLRKKLRTTLTIGSFVVALFLFSRVTSSTATSLSFAAARFAVISASS